MVRMSILALGRKQKKKKKERKFPIKEGEKAKKNINLDDSKIYLSEKGNSVNILK